MSLGLRSETSVRKPRYLVFRVTVAKVFLCANCYLSSGVYIMSSRMALAVCTGGFCYFIACINSVLAV